MTLDTITNGIKAINVSFSDSMCTGNAWQSSPLYCLISVGYHLNLPIALTFY